MTAEEFDNYVLTRIFTKDPHPDFIDELKTFGQFVGSWDMEVIFYNEKGEEIYHQMNEWTFFWILDGRAIQDVLIGPSADEKLSTETGKRRIGTSVREFDSVEKKWYVSWFGVTTNTHVNLEGELINNEIVLLGKDIDGSKIKWIFKNITKNNFVWEGYISNGQSENWMVDQRMFAKRKKINQND